MIRAHVVQIGRHATTEAKSVHHGWTDVQVVQEPKSCKPTRTWHANVLPPFLPLLILWVSGFLCVVIHPGGGECAQLCVEPLQARGFRGSVDAFCAFLCAECALYFGTSRFCHCADRERWAVPGGWWWKVVKRKVQDRAKKNHKSY